MMKRIFFILIVPVVLYSCSKTDSGTVNNCVSTGGVPTAAEIAEVQTYLTSKGLTATQDSSGLFYNIVSLGYGQDYPFATSNVTASYKGSLKDGTVFDSTTTGNSIFTCLWLQPTECKNTTKCHAHFSGAACIFLNST